MPYQTPTRNEYFYLPRRSSNLSPWSREQAALRHDKRCESSAVKKLSSVQASCQQTVAQQLSSCPPGTLDRLNEHAHRYIQFLVNKDLQGYPSRAGLEAQEFFRAKHVDPYNAMRPYEGDWYYRDGSQDRPLQPLGRERSMGSDLYWLSAQAFYAEPQVFIGVWNQNRHEMSWWDGGVLMKTDVPRLLLADGRIDMICD